MRNLAHLSARLFNTPLMLRPEAASSLSSAFLHLMNNEGSTIIVDTRRSDAPLPEPMAFAGNAPISRFKDKPYAVTDEGIALLSITGPLVQRQGAMNPDCTPLASYQRLQSRMESMQQDSDVKGILLEWDSPGGETAGNFALANRMMQYRGSKPLWSYVNELAASAAYSLASATDRIIMPTTGIVGSIGVVMLHLDASERDKKQGLAYTYIYAGDHKIDGNSHAPLSKEARAGFQSMVQSAYDQFTAHVASARSMQQQAVRETQAAVFDGPTARQIGLVDDLGTFEDTLAEITALVQRGPQFSATGGRMAAPNSAKGGTMSQANLAATSPALNAAPPSGDAAPGQQREMGAQVTQEQLQAARAEGVATGITQGAAAERQRISSILGHEHAAHRQQLARTLAFSTDMALEQVTTVLAAAAPEQAAPSASALSPLAAAMANVPNPAIAAAASPAAGDDSSEALAHNVVSLYRQVKGA